ncbi:hypothetical protein N7457_004960 [Penicillium paradoxum]|uniref:uncharacterized protein n=1 Tax=Penicillium paradoxum TaxID=176176 RepID=UPI0025475E78|nr:uncharacterized protein N7457_004960 [Penicillium paradoxum]KAJ5783186.1 hypothetical protein N7457_004960 [Penicillium paradoxum]
MPEQLTWLVTGCSSGLGEALIRAILARRDRAIATARPGNAVSGVDRIASLKEAGAAVLELDLGATQVELVEKAQEAWQMYGHVDVLVHNAGYIEAGVFEELDEQMLTGSLRVNVLGPLNLTSAFLPLMRARKTGTLLFASSVEVYYDAPGASYYSGAKGMMDELVPNLALEVASFGIRTCLSVFGYVRTAVMAPGNMRYDVPNRLPEYEELNKLVKDGCNAGNGNQPGDPIKACELVIEAVRGEGRCVKRKKLPLRLPIGLGALRDIRVNCEEKMAVCDGWNGISSQTDF